MPILLIALLIIPMILVLFWSVKVSKRSSVTRFSIIFLGLAAAFIGWQGFTQQAFENIANLAFIFFVMWFRFSKSIADTARARDQLKNKLSQEKYSTCKVCSSKKLTYHRKPKNVSQLFLGGLTCENCGAELDVSLNIFMPG